jgi:hypothetical protein
MVIITNEVMDPDIKATPPTKPSLLGYRRRLFNAGVVSIAYCKRQDETCANIAFAFLL